MITFESSVIVIGLIVVAGSPVKNVRSFCEEIASPPVPITLTSAESVSLPGLPSPWSAEVMEAVFVIRLPAVPTRTFAVMVRVSDALAPTEPIAQKPVPLS